MVSSPRVDLVAAWVWGWGWVGVGVRFGVMVWGLRYRAWGFQV